MAKSSRKLATRKSIPSRTLTPSNLSTDSKPQTQVNPSTFLDGHNEWYTYDHAERLARASRGLRSISRSIVEWIEARRTGRAMATSTPLANLGKHVKANGGYAALLGSVRGQKGTGEGKAEKKNRKRREKRRGRRGILAA